MIFKNFRLQIVWRIVLLALAFGGGTYFLIQDLGFTALGRPGRPVSFQPAVARH